MVIGNFRRMVRISLGYLYIVGTILFTVYGQVVLKWRIRSYGSLPDQFCESFFFLLRLLMDFYILSGFLAAFIASLFWMAAMTKFELSFAYPFMATNFILVLIISAYLLNEPLTYTKMLGVCLIVLGLIVVAKG